MSRKKTHKIVFSEFVNHINKIIDDKYMGDKYKAAETWGVSYETVRRWCHGDNLPDGSQLITIKENVRRID